MEQPFYGRTGLLKSGREGLPVRKPRVSPTGLKYYPSLLTIPQVVLEQLDQEGHPVGSDPSLRYFLRIALIIELLARHLRLQDRPLHGALTTRVLDWQAREGPQLRQQLAAQHAASSSGQPHTNKNDEEEGAWFVPHYDMAVIRASDQHMLGRLRRLSLRAVTLFGRDKAVNDVVLDHVSCSAQHAALQMQFVMSATDELEAWLQVEYPTPPRNALPARLDDLDTCCMKLWHKQLELEKAAAQASDHGGFNSLWSIELQLLDLGSTNGVSVDGERVEAYRPFRLIEGDTLRFGACPLTYLIVRSDRVD